MGIDNQGRVLVLPDGPLTARIAFVGEAAGETEEATGKPFVGRAGMRAKDWWHSVGIRREDIYIDNVVQYRPKGNKIESVPPREIHEYWIPRLKERLSKLIDPYVIVPCGNYATFALTGKGRVKGAGRRGADEAAGITSLRGSLLEWATPNPWNRPVKVIPTIHPAAVLRMMKWENRTLFDWRKITSAALSREIVRPFYRFLIEPTDYELKELFEIAGNSSSVLSIDIETWGKTLSCVGFGVSPTVAYVLPTARREERSHYLPIIKQLAESSSAKVLQNGLYDLYWLAAYGITVRNYEFDTLALHHSIDPAEDHDLNYLSSIYRPSHVYWKDEAKSAEEIVKYAHDRDAVHQYNALDCVATFDVWMALVEEVMKKGMWEFYFRHYQAMFQPLHEMMREGIKCDVERQKEWAEMLERECDHVREQLKELAGEELYATKQSITLREPTTAELNELFDGQEIDRKKLNKEVAKRLSFVMTKRKVKEKKFLPQKDFSGKKLKDYFYGKLGIPKQFKLVKTRGESDEESKETLDKGALLKIALKYKKAEESARLILSHRRKAKLTSFLSTAKDKDGRFRCSYKLNTEAGRLATGKNPMGGGGGLNQDREIRNTFLPDTGHIWLKFDGSAVEDRIVKMLTGSPRLQEMANLRPENFDAHSYNASLIYGVPVEEVTGKMRQDSKFVAHGGQRQMSAKTLAEKFLKDAERIVPMKACQEWLDAYLQAHPEIEEGYWPWVREHLLKNNKVLGNSWGRIIDFGSERFDNELYRRAYSWYAQSECHDWLMMWGFLPAYEFLKGKRSRLMMEEHDGFDVSAHSGEAWEIAKFVVSSLEKPRYLRGGVLVTPTVVTVGRSWAGEKDNGVEFKRLPTKSDFNQAVDAVLRGASVDDETRRDSKLP